MNECDQKRHGIVRVAIASVVISLFFFSTPVLWSQSSSRLNQLFEQDFKDTNKEARSEGGQNSTQKNAAKSSHDSSIDDSKVRYRLTDRNALQRGPTSRRQTSKHVPTNLKRPFREPKPDALTRRPEQRIERKLIRDPMKQIRTDVSSAGSKGTELQSTIRQVSAEQIISKKTRFRSTGFATERSPSVETWRSEQIAVPSPSTEILQKTPPQEEPATSSFFQLDRLWQNRRGRSRQQVEIRATPSLSQVQIKQENGLITLVAKDALLHEVLGLLADQYGLNFVFSSELKNKVTVSLRGVSLENALTSVLAVAGFAWTQSNGIIHITDLTQQDTLRVAPEFTGKQVRVFQLDYVSAESISQALNGMLSPIGTSYTITSDPKNNLKTTESIVVEDLPGSLARISQYIAQVDVAPRQVMIEVHVLEIDHSLTDTRGVNFEDVFNVASSNFRVGILGSPPAGDGTVFAELTTGSFRSVVQALQNRVNAKTLASPKVLALNGQEARIQVGQQLGFRVVTTTQTSTLEEVRFLNVGVVLSVTPRISRDGRIMLQIKPEVSSGRINPDTGLPEEETSEVETNVMLSHGKGMIIGGLIQESNVETVSKVPGLSDQKLIGGLFRQKRLEKTRKEYIFVLMPRVIDPYQDDLSVPLDQELLNRRDRMDVARGATRTMNQCLDCIPQPLEGVHRQEERIRADQWQNDQGHYRGQVLEGQAFRTTQRELHNSNRTAARNDWSSDRRSTLGRSNNKHRSYLRSTPPIIQPNYRSYDRR